MTMTDTACPSTVHPSIQDVQEEWISPHFRLSDLTVSGLSVRYRIDNTPPPETVSRLAGLCREVLEPLRRRFGVIRITSAYRCEALHRIACMPCPSPYLTGDAADLHVSGRQQGERMIAFISQHRLPADASLQHREHSGVWRVQVRRKRQSAR